MEMWIEEQSSTLNNLKQSDTSVFHLAWRWILAQTNVEGNERKTKNSICVVLFQSCFVMLRCLSKIGKPQFSLLRKCFRWSYCLPTRPSIDVDRDLEYVSDFLQSRVYCISNIFLTILIYFLCSKSLSTCIVFNDISCQGFLF